MVGHRVDNLVWCQVVCLGHIRCVESCRVCNQLVMPIVLVDFCVRMVGMVVVGIVTMKLVRIVMIVVCGLFLEEGTV